MLVMMSMVSCEKHWECIEHEDEFLFLKPEVKNSIPYQDGQIVNFERAGEIYSFVVDSKLDTVRGLWSICNECCSDSVFRYEELLFVELYDSIHQMRFSFTSRGHYRTMFLAVYPFTIGQYSDASTVLMYSLDTGGDFICDYDSLITLNGTICHDTITIGSTLYYDVAEIRYNPGWFFDTRQVFYSQEKGILKVTFRYDVIDELIHIE